MSWHTNELAPGNVLVQDGSHVVGSIKLTGGGAWQVEILWTGGGGDLTFEGRDYTEALAFVAGVEKAWAAFITSFSQSSSLPFPDTIRAVIAALPDDKVEGLKTLDAARRLVERFKR